MKVYLSSTFNDLKRHRAILARALRKAGYDVLMMEEYVARDQQVEFACQGDVLECGVYVGVFAWRYGHVPVDNNPERLSVTEMEYAAAGGKPMTRLTFLLDEKARWPKDRRDADPARINDLRGRLKNRCSAYFSSAHELAMEVLAALRVHENTRSPLQVDESWLPLVQRGEVPILDSPEVQDPSYEMNTMDKLRPLFRAQFIELHIRPTSWWNTRLYLLAALVHEFGRARGFVLLDGEDKFLLMAAPSEIRHRLALRWPALEQAYGSFRREAPTLERMEHEVRRYSSLVAEAFGAEEVVAAHWLSVRDLDYELGIARDAELVDVREKGTRFLQQEILGRPTPFVALVRDRRFEGLVDRQLLAQLVAQAALSQLA